MTDYGAPAGWIRGIRLMMNGRTVTMAELHAAWPDDPDDCAPGLGYVCPSHRAARVDDAPWSAIERGPMIRQRPQ